jgi:5S rRNA maturation endonuclease (ribonuclease M5)
MTREDILKFLTALGAENVSEGPKWIKCSCPLARWYHRDGTDDRPSFGIKIGDNSKFNCFSCGKTGPVSYLPTMLRMLTGREWKELYGLSIGGVSVNPRSAPVKPKYMPRSVFLKMFSVLDFNYRGLDKATIEEHEIRFDTREKRVVIPILDEKGRIAGIKGRTIINSTLRHKLYTGKDGPEFSDVDPKSLGVWYGIDRSLAPRKALILTEGEFDVLALLQSGIQNVWGCLGVGVTSAQMKTLARVRNPLWLFFDNDVAGKQLVERIVNELSKTHSISIIREYSGLKDAYRVVREGKLYDALKSIDKRI